MRLAGRFFQLIRWPNLLFIGLTQILFYYCVFDYVIRLQAEEPPPIKPEQAPFYFILFSSLFIAAAGYIINDYFDIDIDKINKKEGIFIGRYFPERTALLLHSLFSLAGIVFTALASWWLQNIWILILNFTAILLLLFYSAFFKRKFLTGNILVSFLTAWTILILAMAEYSYSSTLNPAQQTIWKPALLYGGFAFLISMIREVIKDLEDLEGDKKFGCTTLPVVLGVKKGKNYTGILIILLTVILLVFVAFLLRAGWLALSVYSFLFIILPLVYILIRLSGAKNTGDFHFLSQMTKLIMLTGILSMIFFYFAK